MNYSFDLNVRRLADWIYLLRCGRTFLVMPLQNYNETATGATHHALHHPRSFRNKVIAIRNSHLFVSVTVNNLPFNVGTVLGSSQVNPAAGLLVDACVRR